jgi:hypothetical protein
MGIAFGTFLCFFEMGSAIKDFVGEDYYIKLISNKAWIGAKRVSTLRRQFLSGIHPSLPQLIWATQFHEAQHKDTKIYALLSVLSPEERTSNFIPDYRLGSKLQTFKQAAMHILSKHKNLDLLSSTSCHHRQDKEGILRLRFSWVPDFGISGQEHEPFVKGIFGPLA